MSLTGYAGAMLAERVGVGVAAGLAPGALLRAFGIDESEIVSFSRSVTGLVRWFTPMTTIDMTAYALTDPDCSPDETARSPFLRRCSW